ncbi:metallophosphoesterase [Qaidamihabitans albus]|uniref:metallophosphoesterase n=1 Tax=Qaidamihabitans albus TaxID=2795733 RepID=UPI0018F112B2|nr:metallophosphoesterase [Qaidamihabitans albus]
MIVLAHLSDTHLDGGARNAGRTARVMAYLAGLTRPVDAVVVTGDIADHGTVSEYEEARELFSVPGPVLTCPGNHDDRARLREVLLGRNGGDAPANQVYATERAVLAVADSSVPGRDDGFLADETISWLGEVLEDAPAGKPVFVCFHHPPVALHIPYVDDIRQRGEERLAALIAGHPQVAAILCGHAHTAAATTFAGRPVLVAPSVSSTLLLPWERGETVDYGLPPMIAFHVLGDDGRLTTHYRVVDRQV